MQIAICTTEGEKKELDTVRGPSAEGYRRANGIASIFVTMTEQEGQALRLAPLSISICWPFCLANLPKKASYQSAKHASYAA